MLSSVEPEVWLRKLRMRDKTGLSKTVTENNSTQRDRTREQMHEVTQNFHFKVNNTGAIDSADCLSLSSTADVQYGAVPRAGRTCTTAEAGPAFPQWRHNY